MKNFAKIALVAALSCTLVISGCSTAWVSTLSDILEAAVPALVNILNIISIAKGQPYNTALAAKINADASNIKVLAADFASASASAAPTACSQLQSAVNTYSQDEAEVLAIANVADPATQSKIATLSALVAGTITGVLAVIPNCQDAAKMKVSLQATTVPLPLKSFVKSYNATLVVKTGVPAVDSYTRGHKIPTTGSRIIKILTIGHVK